MSALTDVHPPTKKRKRMHYACVECNRRKHKCDRKIPCGPCTQRGIAESCRPFEDGDEHGDLRSRLGRVEHLLEGLLAREKAVGAMPVPAPPESTTARSVTSSASERREPEEHEEHLDGGLTGAAGNYFGGNALPSVTSTSIEAEVRGNPNSAQAHSSTISARTTQANLALRQIIAEGGAHPDVLLSLLSELPPKDDIGTLLEIFFRDINPVRFPLPERDIRRAFDELNAFTWGSAREDGDDGASHLIFLPLLFMIIATTTFCLPLCMSKRVDSKTQAKRYYHSYRRAASIASLLPATTTLLYAHMLATRFLIIIRTPADAWSLLGATLRTAQALGLHRDGGRLGLPAPEAERRRRLWAHLFYSDASMCLMLGRPMGVRVGDCDTLPPGQTRLKEDSQDEVADDVRIWDDNPTRWTFVALRHSLSQITSRVVEHFQDLAGGRHYDTVLALDREIVTFYEALPPAYRLDGGEHARETMGERQRGRQTNGRQDSERKGKSRSSDRGTIAESIHPDDAMDGENEADEQPSKPPPYEDPEPGAYPMLPTHRFMINTEVQYVRIALHRPYVLRGGEKYNPSRTACFEAARIDRRAREVFRREVQWPDHRARRDHMGGLYRLFNSTMILGIALLLNPAGPNSAELRGYLDDFIKLHAAQAAHDVTSAREVKIIQLFRAKADDALRLRSPVKSNQGSGTSTPTPQMTREPPNQISHTRHPGARAFSLDSHNAPPFPPSSRTTPPHTSTRIMSPPPGSRRPRSKTSLSSVLIPKSGIDNPPLPPGMSPTTFHPQPFSSPQTTFAVSHHRRSSSASLSPTTPRDAQTLLSPAPRAVSPFLMSGITNSESGTPPTINNPPLAPDNPNTSTPFGQSHDILPFPDDTQALFDQASWQYALANPGSMGLGWDWASGAPPGPSGLGLGLGLGVGELGALDNFGFGFGSGVTGGLGDAGVLGGSDTSASPPTLVVTHAESPEELLAPGTESRVRSGSTGGAKGKAPEGWGYWEGLVDAIGPTARVALAADHHHVYPIYVNIANGSYVCHWCVRTHLQELRAPITKAGAERQLEVERAARLLGGGVEKGRWARAETHTLQESVSAMKAELMARKAANRSAQQRLDKRKRSVADRRDNLHLARELLPPSAAVSFSPTLSPAPSMPTQENTIPFASTSPPTTSRLSRLRHEPPNPTADAKQALADMGDALAETRSVLVRELADAYELQEELRQSAGRDVRMWTMGRMELPTIDDLARQKPSQLHTTLYNVLHFMQLTAFYLGVKLPFGVGWGASSTIAPPFPELFIPGSDAGKLETINEDGEGSGIAPIGVGTPWIVASRGLGGSSDGGWGKYGTPLALHLPAHSRDTTSTPKAGLQPAPSSRPHRTESRSSTVPGVPPAPSTPSKRRPGLLSLSRMSAAAKYVAGSAYPSSPRTTATSSHSQTLGGALPTRASLASSSTAPPKTRQRAGSVSIQANPPVRARVASLATAPTRTESLIGEDKEASQGTEPLYNAAYLAWTQGALNVGEVDRVPGILELLGVTVVSEGIGFASHVTSSAQVHALPPPTRSFTLSFPLLLSHNLSQIGGLTSAGLPSHDGDGEWDLIEASEEEDGVG